MKKSLSEIILFPLFWAEEFTSINECKTNKGNNIISDNDFLSEPLWFNTRFKIKGKIVFYHHWSKSKINYVKDLFDLNGDFINEETILNKLVIKVNWISEYSCIKTMLNKLIDEFEFNTRNAPFVNIKNAWTLTHKNSIYNLRNQKSNFYYPLLIDKKFIRNYMEHAWERDFNIPPNAWPSIYTHKVWKLVDRKLAEFNYKILCNILSNRALVSKWNNNIDNKCPFCDDIQNTKHLLFECPRVNNIWVLIGSILQVNITYKHIVIGNEPDSDFIKNRNLLISYIAYAIYKHWVQSENNIHNFNTSSLQSFIKKDLFSRTFYIKDQLFVNLVDKTISSM